MSRRRRLRVLVGLTVLSTTSTRAACPYPQFTPAPRIQLGTTAVLVTHASTEFDSHRVSAIGLDDLVAAAKRRKMPVVYLQEPELGKAPRYFYGDCQPTHYFASYGGEFDFVAPSEHVVTAGGFFENCKERTVQHVLRQWRSRAPAGNLRISEVMDASYQIQGHMTPQDPYYSTFLQQARASGIWTLTLLSFLRIVPEGLRFDYLRRYLAKLAGDFPSSHRIVMKWNGRDLAVFRESTGTATLELDFVTGAESISWR